MLPATHLPRESGPAVWRVGSEEELAAALALLLREPLERRSRGHAAAAGAAKLASGLVNTVWHVLDDQVITPALHAYVQQQQQQAGGAVGGSAGGAAVGSAANNTAPPPAPLANVRN